MIKIVAGSSSSNMSLNKTQCANIISKFSSSLKVTLKSCVCPPNTVVVVVDVIAAAVVVVVVVVVVRTYLSDFLLITGSVLDINFPKSALCLFELALMNFPPILLLGGTSSGTFNVLFPKSSASAFST